MLIDFENVQPSSLEALSEDHYRVIVFVGATQVKVPFDVASAIQRMGDRAEYVKIAGTGPNALDFHIAYYLGRMTPNEPEAHYHVISRDTGFDPLITHLTAQGIKVSRWAAIEKIPPIHARFATAANGTVDRFVQMLRQPKSTRPRTERTLKRALQTFSNELSVAEVDTAVNTMRSRKIIAIADGKVTYPGL